MYKEIRSARSEFVPIRGLSYHVHQWNAASAHDPAKPALVLLHGWMDVGASYQFMVDALSNEFAEGRTIIAPDWRGFGQTLVPQTDSFWFPDYLADLDFLLDHYAPGQAVDLVGHSMGGNVVMNYAGVRPQRVRRLVNLEGFGMAATRPSQAAGRYADWLDKLHELHEGKVVIKPYDSADAVAGRLIKTNPRLSPDKAAWLAERWASPDANGGWAIQGNPAHKLPNPQLYRADETLELYARITAPTLMVEASDDSLEQWWKGAYTLDQFHERLKRLPDVRTAVLADTGHMLHHDQPQPLARLVEDFLS
ncbi:MAG: alpha/beta hydrolase [Pseudomonadota bacterium]